MKLGPLLIALNLATSAAGAIWISLADFAARRWPARSGRWLTAALIVASALAWGTYFRWGQFRFGRYVNPPDVFHYYMGAKYSRELGYSHLYRCALVADANGRRVYRQETIRNLADRGFESTADVLAAPEQCTRRFSTERWREFAQDVGYFVSLMPAAKWNRVLRDKGYNATPVWNMIARFLAQRLPTDGALGLWPLLALDPLLLLAMMGAIWVAFGTRTTLLTLLFFGSSFFISQVHIKNSFLRLDWLVTLVAAACLLKLGRHAAAGACTAYAATARVFPAIFAFGVFARLVWDWRTHRRIDRKYWAFFGAMAAVTLVLGGLSMVQDGGAAMWSEFRAKMAVHNVELSTTRVGFKYLLLTLYDFDVRWGAFVRGNNAWFGHYWPPWWMIQGVVIVVCFWAARRLEPYEALALGVVPAYFLTAPTFYYWIMLTCPFVWLASRIERPAYAAGATWLFVVSLVGHAITARPGIGFGQSYALSCMLAVFVVHVLVLALRAPPPPADPARLRGS